MIQNIYAQWQSSNEKENTDFHGRWLTKHLHLNPEIKFYVQLSKGEHSSRAVQRKIENDLKTLSRYTVSPSKVYSKVYKFSILVQKEPGESWLLDCKIYLCRLVLLMKWRPTFTFQYLINRNMP